MIEIDRVTWLGDEFPKMFSVFMSYGNGVRILSPEKAANYMKSILEDSLESYEK
ncbi:MAG: hypothetical protein IJ887_08935 [Prevotella sp.]|nr:hypothetical protein [Prevotella sp.]